MRKRKAENEEINDKRVHFGNVDTFQIENLIGKSSLKAKQDNKKVTKQIQLKKRQDRVKIFNDTRKNIFWSPDDLNIFAHAIASSFAIHELRNCVNVFVE